ncbi:MAG: hypothetical protein GY820_38115, partial [Gammaproteobacteria bacterium]|nr:hypothetical protein [Gammaproteobacteria bacterium]
MCSSVRARTDSCYMSFVRLALSILLLLELPFLCGPMRGGLSVYSANVNGILSKLDGLKALLFSNSVDILLLQETKLCNSVSDLEVSIPGYSLLRLDRNRNGGGVAILARDYLNLTKFVYSSTSEILAGQIYSKCGKITVLSCYKPPKEDAHVFCSSLTDFLATLGAENTARSVICGDFNLDPTKPESAPLLKIAADFSVHQQVSSPTHCSRIIDLCFTGKEIRLKSCSLLDPIEKLHAVVALELIIPPDPCPIPKKPTNPRPIYSKAYWPLVRRCLADCGLLHSVVSTSNVEEAWLLWSSKVKQIITSLIPHSNAVRKSKAKPPWLSISIQKLLKAKTAAWKRWKADSSDLTLYSTYSRLRRKCKKEIIVAKRDQVRAAFADCSSIQQFWRTYRLLSNLSGLKRPISFPSSSKEPCENLANHFDSVWNQVQVDGPSTVPERAPAYVCTVSSVAQNLSRLKVQKSTGCDGIPAVFLKQCCDSLAPSLSHLFNRSLIEGTVPSEWKDAIVTPVPKVSAPTCPAAFRPISLLPI